MKYKTRSQRAPEVFTDLSGEHGVVVLNWVGTPEREFAWYGEYFHEAGRDLAQRLREDERFGLFGYPPDSFKAVPIVFLYRHAMELLLKAVIRNGEGVLPFRGLPRLELAQVFRSHSLQQLLEHVEEVFDAFGWLWTLKSTGFSSLPDVLAVIRELEEIDGGSFAFRYPTKKDGETGALDHGFRFNLFEFCDRLDPMLERFRGLADAARDELEDLQRSAAEQREAARDLYDGED